LFLLLNALSQDEWFTLRVLGYAIQHPILILADRQNTLRTIRRILDRVRAKVEAETKKQEKSGWERLFEAAYFVLSAQVCEEAGNVKEALRNYRQAQAIYQELGFSQPLHKIVTEIKRLQAVVAPAAPASKPVAQSSQPATAPVQAAPKITPGPASPAPAAAVSQQAETERLAAQIQAQNRAVSDLQSRIRQFQEQRDRLTSEIAAQEQRLKASRQPAPAAPGATSEPAAQTRSVAPPATTSTQNRGDSVPDQEQADQITALSRQVRHLQEQLRIEKENSQRLLQQNRQAASQPKPAGADLHPLPAQELEELRQKISEAQAEDERLKEQIQQKQARLEKLEQRGQQKEALLQEIAELKRKVKDMLRDQENLSTQQDELEERRRKRTSELGKLDSEIHARTIEKQKLEEQIQQGLRKKDNTQ
jgi:predicted  nucleic acid-binding Zn-ribbon protein